MFLYQMFRHSEAKVFRGIILMVPPLLSINFFDIGKLLKHSIERFPYGTFRYCETKHFRQKIVIAATSFIPNIFRYQKFSESQKGSLTKFFSTVKQNFYTENRDTHSLHSFFFLIHKIFRHPNLVIH